MISPILLASLAVASAGFTATDWGKAIDFKPQHVVFTAVRSAKSDLLNADVEKDPLWYPVTTLPDAVLKQGSSFLQRENPDESLYGFHWALVSKSQLDGEKDHSTIKGTEYLMYRVPVSGQSHGDLERASHKMPSPGDGFEYAVSAPDTMQILNVGSHGEVHQGSLPRTETMRMAFKTVMPEHGGKGSSFLQGGEQTGPIIFKDFAEYQKPLSMHQHKLPPVTPKAALNPTLTPLANQVKNVATFSANRGLTMSEKLGLVDVDFGAKNNLERLETLENSFLETEAKTVATMSTGLVPLFMMTGNAILTGGMNYNQAVMTTHANAEGAWQSALTGAASTGHPVAVGAAAVNGVGSQVRTTAVQAVGNVHNTVLGHARQFTAAWIPQGQK